MEGGGEGGASEEKGMLNHTCWLLQSQGCDPQFLLWPHPRKQKSHEQPEGMQHTSLDRPCMVSLLPAQKLKHEHTHKVIFHWAVLICMHAHAHTHTHTHTHSHTHNHVFNMHIFIWKVLTHMQTCHAKTHTHTHTLTYT